MHCEVIILWESANEMLGLSVVPKLCETVIRRVYNFLGSFKWAGMGVGAEGALCNLHFYKWGHVSKVVGEVSIWDASVHCEIWGVITLSGI